MPNASNAKLEYESGQTAVDYTALTDQGDNTEFKSAASLWSNRSGYEPSIRPNGLISGCAVTVAASGSNNVVDVAAGAVYLAGVEISISADTDVSITRATSTDTHMINSNQINGIIDVIEHIFKVP